MAKFIESNAVSRDRIDRPATNGLRDSLYRILIVISDDWQRPCFPVQLQGLGPWASAKKHVKVKANPGNYRS